MTQHAERAPARQQIVGLVNHLYGWACERLYHEFAWSYNVVSWGVSFGRWQHWRNSVWPHVQGKDVLELGSGPGHLLVEGSARGYRMVGVDLSAAMVALARRRQLVASSVCPLVLTDGRKLPFCDGSFDSLIATFPAGYILTAETLHECWRVLKPAGRLVVVGLWVGGGPWWTAWLPVFYVTPDKSSIGSILSRFAASGFDAKAVELEDREFRIGAILAQKA